MIKVLPNTEIHLICNDSSLPTITFYSVDGSYPSIIYNEKIIIDKNLTLKYFSIDAASNVETIHEEIFIVDDTPPIALILNPPNSTTIQHTYTFQIGGEDVILYKYKLNNDNWSNEILVNNTIDLTKLLNGIYTLSVIGVDDVGNWQLIENATIIEWLINNIPIAIIDNPPDSTTFETSFNTTISGNIVSYKYKLNENDWSNEISLDIPITLTSLIDGEYTLSVIGVDEVGNWQSIENATVTQWLIDTVIDWDFTLGKTMLDSNVIDITFTEANNDFSKINAYYASKVSQRPSTTIWLSSKPTTFTF